MTLTKRIGSAAVFGAALLIGLQTANAGPTPGKACHATSKGADEITINDGTYNDNGECCSPRLNNAPPGTPMFGTTYGNVAPRLGAAYRLRDAADRETILRSSHNRERWLFRRPSSRTLFLHCVGAPKSTTTVGNPALRT